MKTTIKSTLVLLFAASFLPGCEQCSNISIAEPTVEDTEWLVYGNAQEVVAGKPTNLKDTILFKTENNDTIQYFRTAIYAQNTPGDGYSVEDECVEQLNTQVTNIIEDENKQYPLLGTFILTKPDSLLVRIAVDKTGTWDIKPQGETLDKEVINDTPYTNVYEITGTGTKPTDVKKIYFNKAYGFLKVEFVNGKSLSLVEIK